MATFVGLNSYTEPVATMGFRSGSVKKNPPADGGDLSLLPGWPGRFPGEGNDYSLQYFCLGNPMDKAAWRATQSVGLQRVRHDL